MYIDTHGPQSSMTMERILLGVLHLSGWYVFSSCLLHQYHFVAESMNWTEAQTYCREKYTDLATIQNTEEMNQLVSSVSSSDYKSDVWIGLYGTVGWRWSDGYKGKKAEYRDWPHSKAPFYYRDNFFCVMMRPNQPWLIYDCLSNRPFICNNGTELEPAFVLVTETLNWFSAQSYCRENFTDLATVRNDKENQEIQNLLNTYTPWIGLFRDTNVYWSDGNDSSFRSLLPPNGSMSLKCGSVSSGNDTKLWLLPCEGRHPFVCYTNPESPIKLWEEDLHLEQSTSTLVTEVKHLSTSCTSGSSSCVYTPVKKQVVKVKIKSGDSVDLNDPAVKANILKEFQERLKERGVSGVTLKWREQHDGKVFNKEEKHP